MDIFKSKEHEAGFEALRKDYEIFEGLQGITTRLGEKILDQIEEQFTDAIYDCFLDSWFELREPELNNTESAGEVRAVFEVVDAERTDVWPMRQG
jgi:hypothetical protein